MAERNAQREAGKLVETNDAGSRAEIFLTASFGVEKRKRQTEGSGRQDSDPRFPDVFGRDVQK